MFLKISSTLLVRLEELISLELCNTEILYTLKNSNKAFTGTARFGNKEIAKKRFEEIKDELGELYAP